MSLDLEEDPKFLRTNWIVERTGWALIFLIVIAGLAGIMGRGPLGNKTVRQHSLNIQYDNVMRRSAPGMIEIEAYLNKTSTDSQSSSKDTAVSVFISQEIYEGCDPDDIRPSPKLISATDDGTMLTLAVATDPVSAQKNTSITMTLLCKPKESGQYKGFIARAGESKIPVSIFVLP